MSAVLVVFDADSTLFVDEAIDLLADEAGVGPQVAAVTARAMAGELDFAQSLHQRVATLADLDVAVLARVRSRIRVSDGAADLIGHIHAAGGSAGVVSGGFVEILKPHADQLGLDFVRANGLEVQGGKLTGRTLGPVIDAQAKLDALREWQANRGARVTVAVGDGMNDALMIEAADLGVAYRAKARLRPRANVVLDIADLSQLKPLFTVAS